MKLRKTLLTIAISALTINAFATNGVRIISEKITVSPGFSGGFYSLTEKKIYPDSATANVFVSGKSGRVNEYIRLDANHSINILNRESKTQRYSYHYTLKCSEGEAKFDRTIEIDPNGRFQDASYSYLTIQKSSPGTYRIEAETKVDGADNASARDAADLSVYK